MNQIWKRQDNLSRGPPRSSQRESWVVNQKQKERDSIQEQPREMPELPLSF